MKGDRAVESGAEKLEKLSNLAAAKGGMAAKLAPALAEDAVFLGKLKPSLMVKRAKGELPKNAEPGAAQAPKAPWGPQHPAQKTPDSGPNPFVVAGTAFGVGSLLAKVIDWRGHAHPRR